MTDLIKITAQYDIIEDQYIISSDDIDLYDEDDVVIALKNMSVYYTDLVYIGYIDGDTFIVKKIINKFTGKPISKDELDNMYYEAFQPECIVID